MTSPWHDWVKPWFHHGDHEESGFWMILDGFSPWILQGKRSSQMSKCHGLHAVMKPVLTRLQLGPVSFRSPAMGIGHGPQHNPLLLFTSHYATRGLWCTDSVTGLIPKRVVMICAPASWSFGMGFNVGWLLKFGGWLSVFVTKGLHVANENNKVWEVC